MNQVPTSHTARIAERQAIVMTDGEKREIQLYAAGNRGKREAAEAAYFRCLPNLEGHRKIVEMSFMSEATNKVPDLLLRARYRKELVAKLAPSEAAECALMEQNFQRQREEAKQAAKGATK